MADFKFNLNAKSFVPNFTPKNSTNSQKSQNFEQIDQKIPKNDQNFKNPKTEIFSPKTTAKLHQNPIIEKPTENIKNSQNLDKKIQNDPKIIKKTLKIDQKTTKNSKNDIKTTKNSKNDIKTPKNDQKTTKIALKFHDDRPHLNIVFIGHVDAGKSTTCGQILMQTGQADERVVNKFKEIAKEKNRDSWWIAYIMDTNEEERSKGKTTEVGMANFETETRRYTILDAPGHKNYVPAMISGAAQADIGILVVSARKGEFEAGFQRGGQTREHALLAKTLGISKIIIAVNKMDEETVKWSEKRYDLIVKKTTTYLRQCGYRAKDISAMVMSGLTGQNLCSPIQNGICDWYKGPHLMSLLDSQKIHQSKSTALRIPIVDRYKDSGTIATSGKVQSGVISVDSQLALLPGKVIVECAAVKIDEVDVAAARVGENVIVSLKGCDINEISSGMVLCDLDNLAPVGDLIECHLYITELLPHKPLIAKGYSAVFHIHSATVECELLRFKSAENPSNNSEKSAEKTKENTSGKNSGKRLKFLKAQNTAIVKIKLARPVVLETFENHPHLGRFTLRDEGKTIAIGRVLKIALSDSK